MMMKPVHRSNSNKVYYPYLQEIYAGDIVCHLRKQGVYDQLIKKFLDRNDPLYDMDSEMYDHRLRFNQQLLKKILHGSDILVPVNNNKEEQALKKILRLKPADRSECVTYLKNANKHKRLWMLAVADNKFVTKSVLVLAWLILLALLVIVSALPLTTGSMAMLALAMLVFLPTWTAVFLITGLISSKLEKKRNQFYNAESPFQNLDDERDSTISNADTDDINELPSINQLDFVDDNPTQEPERITLFP